MSWARLAEEAGQRESEFVSCRRKFCFRSSYHGDPTETCCKLCAQRNDMLEESATIWGEKRADGRKESHGPMCNKRWLGDGTTAGEWKLADGERSER